VYPVSCTSYYLTACTYISAIHASEYTARPTTHKAMNDRAA
jgi:hypothetical protein